MSRDSAAEAVRWLDQAKADWAELDQYYIPTRYPDALPGGIPSEVFGTATAAAALQVAAATMQAVEDRLSHDQP